MNYAALVRPLFNNQKAFWPGLQVLEGYFDPAIRTHTAFLRVWKRYGFTPEGFKIATFSVQATAPLMDSGKDVQNRTRYLIDILVGCAASKIVNISQTEIVCGRFEQLHVSTKLKHGSTHFDLTLKYYDVSSPEGSLAQDKEMQVVDQSRIEVRRRVGRPFLSLGCGPSQGSAVSLLRRGRMCEAAGLEDALCKRVMITPVEVIKRSLDHLSTAVSRDGLTKTLYSRFLC
ncbi:hypothetical protein AgCh_017611 [Apium graveolens]